MPEKWGFRQSVGGHLERTMQTCSQHFSDRCSRQLTADAKPSRYWHPATQA
jgi:hypothetical protein